MTQFFGYKLDFFAFEIMFATKSFFCFATEN